MRRVSMTDIESASTTDNNITTVIKSSAQRPCIFFLTYYKNGDMDDREFRDGTLQLWHMRRVGVTDAHAARHVASTKYVLTFRSRAPRAQSESK